MFYVSNAFVDLKFLITWDVAGWQEKKWRLSLRDYWPRPVSPFAQVGKDQDLPHIVAFMQKFCSVSVHSLALEVRSSWACQSSKLLSLAKKCQKKPLVSIKMSSFPHHKLHAMLRRSKLLRLKRFQSLWPGCIFDCQDPSAKNWLRCTQPISNTLKIHQRTRSPSNHPASGQLGQRHLQNNDWKVMASWLEGNSSEHHTTQEPWTPFGCRLSFCWSTQQKHSHGSFPLVADRGRAPCHGCKPETGTAP